MWHRYQNVVHDNKLSYLTPESDSVDAMLFMPPCITPVCDIGIKGLFTKISYLAFLHCMIFLLEFKTVLTVWYIFWFIILICGI